MMVRCPTAAFRAAKPAAWRRRLRHVELEVAGGHDMGRAEIAIAAGMRIGLREAEVEATQQRCDRGGDAPPSVERALGKTAVDQDQGDAAFGTGHDQVGPKVGFDEDGQIGLPVIEEAIDEARGVQNHELMDGAWRQALRGEIGRRNRAGRAQYREVLFTDSLDERDDRQ